MAFYTYRQNNSGGSFVVDRDGGIACTVIVEGDSIADINARAESIGLYFDGDGDCPCCGDRWSEAYSWDGTNDLDDSPSIYNESLVNHGDVYYWVTNTKWNWTDPEGYIHFKDGRVVPIVTKNSEEMLEINLDLVDLGEINNGPKELGK